MKSLAVALGACVVSMLAIGAKAQGPSDSAGQIVEALQAAGAGIGQGLGAGSSVSVYAVGKVKLDEAVNVAPSATGYTADFVARAPTAAEAMRLRDSMLEKARAAASLNGSAMEAPTTSVSYGSPAHIPLQIRPAVPSVVAPGASQAPGAAATEFMVTSQVQFSRPPPGREAALLDGLRDAGAEGIRSAGPVPSFNVVAGLFGPAAAASVDPHIWEAAMRDAVHTAREDAGVLAAADGRSLGPAQQMILVSRNVQGGEASVTVAARFALAPPPP